MLKNQRGLQGGFVKYIGNLLLKDDLLSKEKLLECMVEKMESIPHLSRVVYDKNLLSVEQQLEVFKFLSENDTNYMGACKSLNYYDKKFENEILKLIEDKHKTLSEIAISKNYLSWDQLMDIFDRFFNSEGENNNQKEVKPSVEGGDTKLEKKGASKFVTLYMNYFNEEKYNQIRDYFEKFDESQTNAQLEDLKTLLFEVYSSAEFIEANHSIKLLGAIIDLINRLSEGENRQTEFIGSALDIMKKGFLLVWNMRNNIVENTDELFEGNPSVEMVNSCIDELLSKKSK